jgi:hypothetical protein
MLSLRPVMATTEHAELKGHSGHRKICAGCMNYIEVGQIVYEDRFDGVLTWRGAPAPGTLQYCYHKQCFDNVDNTLLH